MSDDADDNNADSARAADRSPSRTRRPPHHGVVSRLRNYFLTGLIVVGPLSITVYLTWSFITWVDDLGAAVHSGRPSPETYLPCPDPGHRPDHRVRRAHAARLPHRQPGRPHAGRVRRGPAQPHADRAADLQDHEADLRDAVLEVRLELPQGRRWSNFRRPACGRWCSCRSRRAATSRRGCREASMSRPSCRARPTRPPASSSTCRARTSSSSTSRSRTAMTLLMSAGMVQPGRRRAEEARGAGRNRARGAAPCASRRRAAK